ncbi:hypothetical protein E2C01_045342 [Portunus trituberculatus]|uniref:Uncharacterized protein n=1 Tax=Portunus trituberculatus TaxID=210409 RepID=A0A5B7G106_PORTR|nr:hypothetical protein [Portunus trituberculatus]
MMIKPKENGVILAVVEAAAAAEEEVSCAVEVVDWRTTAGGWSKLLTPYTDTNSTSSCFLSPPASQDNRILPFFPHSCLSLYLSLLLLPCLSLAPLPYLSLLPRCHPEPPHTNLTPHSSLASPSLLPVPVWVWGDQGRNVRAPADGPPLPRGKD